MACHAVHQQPRTTLPNPVAEFVARRGGFIAWQSIVQPDYPPHYEAAVGHVVGVACGPLLQDAVHKQGANLQF